LFALYFVGIIKRESAAIIFAGMLDSATAKGVAPLRLKPTAAIAPTPAPALLASGPPPEPFMVTLPTAHNST
jgi:hypothetical protein